MDVLVPSSTHGSPSPRLVFYSYVSKSHIWRVVDARLFPKRQRVGTKQPQKTAIQTTDRRRELNHGLPRIPRNNVWHSHGGCTALGLPDVPGLSFIVKHHSMDRSFQHHFGHRLPPFVFSLGFCQSRFAWMNGCVGSFEFW